MRIAVFGATGGTGREVARQALEAGHEVTAVSRRPVTTPPGGSGGLRLLVVDPIRPELVDEALAGQDAVVSALGTNAKGRVSVCADGVRAILAGMERQGVRRLVAVSAHGAAESHDRSLYSMMLWTMLGHKMRDKDAMEALIRASATDWTIVRPPRLTDGPRTGRYRTGDTVAINLLSRISRADLADYMLALATSNNAIGATPKIAL